MAAIDPVSNSGQLRKITVNAGALALGGVIAQVCLILVEALVARKLGGPDYGVFSTVQAIALTSLHCFEFGMGWKLIEDGSRDTRTIAPLLGTTLVLKFGLAALVYAAMLFGLPMAGYGTDVVSFFAIFFGYAVAYGLQESLGGANAARHQMYINAIYQAATPVAVLAFAVLATRTSASLAAVGWAYVAGGALVTGVWTWQLFRAEKPTLDLKRTADIFRGSYLYGIGGFLYQASYRVEVMALSVLSGMADVGLFAAADKFTDIGVKVALLGSRVTAPLMFNQSRHDVAGYARSCRIVLRGSAVLGAAGGLVLATLAEPLVIGIFGESFRGAALILIILAPSVALRFSTAALRLALTSSDQHAHRVGGLAAGVAASALSNVALIPSFGVLGAAWARFVGDVVQIALLLRTRSLPVTRFSLISWMLLPLVLGALSYIAAVLVTANPWLQALLSLVAFAVALTATRCVRVSELREFARAARNKRVQEA
ncbi:MAG: polysaccharide biosynthesis protein [Gammaproteobacteria bacterium]|jgi:O-antigen/teichoic acid export membrane protein|nr:polysaccharide biosynthesis protein [Gammaproteobacteria bacterium]